VISSWPESGDDQRGRRARDLGKIRSGTIADRRRRNPGQPRAIRPAASDCARAVVRGRTPAEIMPRHLARGVAHSIRAVALAVLAGCASPPQSALRFATFNVALNRPAAGRLARDLAAGDAQARAVAEIVQRVRPDVLLLNELDFDGGAALHLFEERYLAVGQNGAAPIRYAHRLVAPVNTGEPSGFDLDHDGRTDGPGDGFGFGRHPGQYGMALLSRLPIDRDAVRTFRHLRWRDMPDAMIPPGWYTPAQRDVLRLSSKSHQDIPVALPDGRTVHVLASHPTPPVFDGPEDRNGRRNHDEIRLWADYISPERAGWIRDDRGRAGGLPMRESFVILGDQNADPHDGDSTARAIRQLLDHPCVRDPLPRSAGGALAAAEQVGANARHRGDPTLDTGDFADDPGPGNLRLDYVLPSRDLDVRGAGVHWPERFESGSDHRLVWVDIGVGRR
jgi:endonuclease/exonuclease/phosphatase family metal-dependent hydrolase